MNVNRDLLDVRNRGEFAFTMCAIGLVLAIISFASAFFALALLGINGRVYLGLLSGVIWLLLNLPIYQTLRRKAKRWTGERRSTKQVTYIEWCSLIMLLGLSLMAGETTGARELIMLLEYLFSIWILALLAYQVLLHLALKYRIFMRDAVRRSIICIFTVFNLSPNSGRAQCKALWTRCGQFSGGK